MTKYVSKCCEWCNEQYNVPPRGAKQSRFCSDSCRYTYNSRKKGHAEWDEWVKVRSEQALKNKAKIEKETAVKEFKLTIAKVIKLKKKEDEIESLTRKCIECGEVFYHPHPSTLTCSNVCSRRRKNRISKLSEGGRINQANLVDKGITLVKLYKRDKGICYLCGERCDFKDREVTQHGHHVVGPDYPSIDHVNPLSKGGKHSWSNVKLAHHSCNTYKRDTYLNEYLEALV